jgi:hypothetical protein
VHTACCCVWCAGYTEHSREGAKYVVDERPTRTRPRNAVGGDPEMVGVI